MPQLHQTRAAFEATIFQTLRVGLRMTRRDVRIPIRALRLLRQQRRAERIRAVHQAAGVHVPPFLIYSITDRCNLDCDGCYDKLLHRATDRQELDDRQVRSLLSDARDLGVSIILLAGGEPLLRDNLLEQMAAFPEILFLLFTNGTLLDEAAIARLETLPHVIPVLSIEGDERFTDMRRGDGTHHRLMDVMSLLRRHRVFFGTSTTLTSANIELYLEEQFLQDLIQRGCGLFYSINYVPVQPGTEPLQLLPDQVRQLERRLTAYRRSLPAIFIAFPHDEVALGGCLAAGRGFIHLSAYGDIEPCPFSPYSDTNITETPLLEALHTPLLQAILNSDVTLDETDGQCALWKRRDWVSNLMAEAPEPDDARSVSPDLLAKGEVDG